MKGTWLALVLILVPGYPAFGAVSPQPGAEDPRIRSVDFDPNQVVLIKGFVGYQLMVEFSPDERIENVAIGDASSWQVTPNRRANLLFIKPLAAQTGTNLTVVTDQHRYTFELAIGGTGAEAEDLAYVVRFRFPKPVETPASPSTSPAAINKAYAVAGAPAIMPAEVFDDGRFTYFRWSPDAAIPAIFAIGADGGESVVNYGVRDGYVAVEQVAQRFVLRSGRQVATVVNRGAASGRAAGGAAR